MADDGLGIGMLVMGIGVDGSLTQQNTETIFAKTILITVDQVGTQPIDGDL